MNHDEAKELSIGYLELVLSGRCGQQPILVIL
jgi:hypothetical protein